MSTIDQNSQNSLSAILDKLMSTGLMRKNRVPKYSGSGRFPEIDDRQLQNQDPFAPMENGDFIAQMAQFSTVTGITDMGETQGLSSQLSVPPCQRLIYWGVRF